MNQLSPQQRELTSALVQRLSAIQGIHALVLGGSHARGRAQPGSDIDLYLFYSEAQPFALESLQHLVEAVNDTPGSTVTPFYGWGRWVNGGVWLTVGGQRVDFLYSSLKHVERVLADAEAGRHELDYAQQPPFGFFGPAYLGEVAVGVPLFDPQARLDALKRRVAVYPEALRRAVVQDYLWAAEFGITAVAPKFAGRSGPYGTASCLARVVHQLLLVLFALKRHYLMDDKTALTEAAAFEQAPQEFGPRVQQLLARLGDTPEELGAAVASTRELVREMVALTQGLYQPRFVLPGLRSGTR